ncbi:MAG: Type II restriction enzyme MjaIII [Candidatus Saccharicenans subterraneus]|uniref:Type-2 restriction enzyme n=1 Tax=Candidatus Saccharicenans subterraneus TaxID=2508984 RepID=A0A3E2BJM8_9BACT|nr:MAG: Type II restriction enzyme MjaIII [Candidatus Saccharicenans subterraneum]
MKEAIYLEFLKYPDISEVKRYFFETLLVTNHDHGFFVDWEKVKNNVKKCQIELNILNTLIRNSNFNEKLKEILTKYPEVLPCVPLLLAIHGVYLDVIEDITADNYEIIRYDFSKRKLTDEEKDQIIIFFEKTGLKKFFIELSTSSLQDYLYGIEVGTDSNARKNRSGRIAEIMLRNQIEKIKDEPDIEVLMVQKSFKELENKGCIVPERLRDRKSDFIFMKKSGKIIDIEVNFYNVSGSKPQEIVDAYLNRQRELNEVGVELIWITDGPGWRRGLNQLEKALDKIDYILNFKLVKIGLLKKILKEI